MVRQERAVRTRQAVLVAAAEVFDQVGYDAASISDILTQSGVTKGALYFHFPSKKDLAQGVLDAQVDALPPVPARELKLQQSMDEAMLLAHLLQKETGDPIVSGSVRLTVDQGSSKDGLDRRVPMQRWLDHTQGLFEQAKQAGEILPHIDVEAITKLVVGAFTGVQVLSNIMTEREDMPERVVDLYQNLMAAIAAPAVLARLQFDVGRGAEVFEEVVRLRDEKAELASP
ncbi:ScbR family autoregulator-binding transcription factor [Streptomyces narbonensis]